MLFAASVAASAIGGCDGTAAPTHVPRDPSLRSLFLYDAIDRDRPPRALIFFIRKRHRVSGSRTGSSRPHWQRHGTRWPDIRPVLSTLPRYGPQRDTVFADSTEIAIWTAAHVRLRGIVGVLALSLGSRSHLRVPVRDIMNGPEPTGPESFSVADAIGLVPMAERVAIVRGARDQYARADSSLLASSGARATQFLVPFAGHSLKRLAMAGFETRRALEWLMPGR